MEYSGGNTVVSDNLRRGRLRLPQRSERKFETAPGRPEQVEPTAFEAVSKEPPHIRRNIWLSSDVPARCGECTSKRRSSLTIGRICSAEREAHACDRQGRANDQMRHCLLVHPVGHDKRGRPAPAEGPGANWRAGADRHGIFRARTCFRQFEPGPCRPPIASRKRKGLKDIATRHQQPSGRPVARYLRPACDDSTSRKTGRRRHRQLHRFRRGRPPGQQSPRNYFSSRRMNGCIRPTRANVYSPTFSSLPVTYMSAGTNRNRIRSAARALLLLDFPDTGESMRESSRSGPVSARTGMALLQNRPATRVRLCARRQRVLCFWPPAPAIPTMALPILQDPGPNGHGTGFRIQQCLQDQPSSRRDSSSPALAGKA